MEAAALTHAAPPVLPRLLRAASDERLVSGVRAGDERCFEVIYDRYAMALLSFCRHMVGTREEAEDALQQVFVAAHRALRADDRALHLRPWLYAIARNRCLSILRARRESVTLDEAGEPVGAGLAVAAEVQQRQDLQDILADLRQLPDDQRAALVLAELDDLSHDEIALALDVRRDKVKALVFQARESLMGYRDAREADCAQIREQLATLKGGALRRGPLQRHVAICPGCAAFKAEVKRQRTAMGAVLPVIPALALRDHILAAVHSGSAAGAAGVAGLGAAGGTVAAGTGAGGVAGGAATAGAGASLAATAGSAGVLAKALAVTALVAGAGGGAVAIRHAHDAPPAHPAVATPAPTRARALPPAGPRASSSAPGHGAASRPAGAGAASAKRTPSAASRREAAAARRADHQARPRKGAAANGRPAVAGPHGTSAAHAPGPARAGGARPAHPAPSRRPAATPAPAPATPGPARPPARRRVKRTPARPSHQSSTAPVSTGGTAAPVPPGDTSVGPPQPGKTADLSPG